MKRQKGKQFSVFSQLRFELLKWQYSTGKKRDKTK